MACAAGGKEGGMSYVDGVMLLDMGVDPDDEDAPDNSRCQRCGAFLARKPESAMTVHGPAIYRWEGVSCSKCGTEAWGYEQHVADVWPRPTWEDLYGPMDAPEPVDYPDVPDYAAMISQSPVVAKCREDGCGNDIRQAEIDLACCSAECCSSCTLDYVRDQFGM